MTLLRVRQSDREGKSLLRGKDDDYCPSIRISSWLAAQLRFTCNACVMGLSLSPFTGAVTVRGSTDEHTGSRRDMDVDGRLGAKRLRLD